MFVSALKDSTPERRSLTRNKTRYGSKTRLATICVMSKLEEMFRRDIFSGVLAGFFPAAGVFPLSRKVIITEG
jgi:hypothetical protein